MVNSIYQILTGVLPSSSEEGEHGDSSNAQGLAGSITDMAVLQNLSHRPKEQVEEALALICELLPPVPKDGVFDAKAYSEKNLQRVKKGRKSDSPSDRPRRSSRVAEASSSTNTAGPSTPVALNKDSSDRSPSDLISALQANREAAAQRARKDAETQMQLRCDLCQSNTELIGQFIKTVLPVLVDVYAASVVLRVRTKVLVGLVKAVSFAPEEQLNVTLKYVPMASFLCAIISSKDNDAFVLHALQIVELLVTKLPDIYQVSFLREGVVYEIEALANSETKKEKAAKEATKNKAGEVDNADSRPATPSNPPGASEIPGDLRSLLTLSGVSNQILFGQTSGQSTPRKSSSHLDPHDANIIRARMLMAKKIFDTGGDNQKAASKVLANISDLVKRLCEPGASEADLREALRETASQFSSVEQSLSSFELLQSGLVDGLLDFVKIQGQVSPADRQAMLFDIFSDKSFSNPNPLTILVKRLHESLGRLESFDVETAFGGGSDPSRPSTSSVHRTMRIRLVADEGEDIPKNVSQLVITIQAIASIKSVHDYLRPRIADGNFGSGFSQMFAAYAAGRSGGAPGSSTSRLLNALAGNPGSGASPGSHAAAPSVPARASSNAESGPSGGRSPQRRRSARLNPPGDAESAADEAPTAAARVTSPSSSTLLSPTTLTTSERRPILPAMSMGMDFDDEEDYSEDEYDAPVIDQVMEEDLAATGPSESVVNMDVTADGSRVEAKTPQGTRIATPQQNIPVTGPSTATFSRIAPSRSSSYAGALKTEPTDWHLEFFLNGEKLDIHDTIYGAIYKHKHATGLSGVNDFVTTPVIKFRKVEGPLPTKETVAERSSTTASSPLPSTFEPSVSSTSKILHLLRVVHDLSIDGRDNLGDVKGSLDENLFVNNKLTAKLTRQLEEILIIASNCLPTWAIDLPKHFSFLFPFDTRYNFLQLTSFGFPRLLLKVQQSSRSRDDMPNIANLLRRKVRISRTQLLESCAKVMEMYATFPGTLEVEYFDEIGTGLGPTLEFYALASKEFARRNLHVWRDEDPSIAGNYVHHPHGLFPSPLPRASAELVASRLKWFKTLGQFIGRSMLDSRIIDISFNKVFLKLLLDKPIKKSLSTLRAVDPSLARSLERLQGYYCVRKEIEALPIPASSRRTKLAALTVGDAKLADLALDFTLPGYDIELKPGGAHIEVDDSNLGEYLEKVLDWTLGSGVAEQVKAFQDGFSSIFPIKSIKIFSLDELYLLFGNADEDWSRETLEVAIKADHGYNQDSRAVQNLIEVMSSYNKEQRRQFLQFMTGAPKLPIGGFRGLTPPFTVVRKPHEPPYKADDYLPSVMTCALYLKMPDYSSKEVLAAQFERAMRDGRGSFLLS